MISRDRMLVLLLLVLTANPRIPAFAADGLSNRIDAHLAAERARAGVAAAGVADDATFLRRVSLDLIGRIPTVAESRTFLNDHGADKRARVVASLLDSGGYARHFATFWRRTWLPQADTPRFANLAQGFESWITGRLADDTPYDQLVHELLTVPSSGGPASAASRTGATSPRAFLAANEFKPENLAASTTRAFLGINLDCAQCHNHPFARWTRDQFWETAAFFTLPTRTADDRPARLELIVPDAARVFTPRFLNGAEPERPAGVTAESGRRGLAEWIIAGDNPYFARNAVNRLWAHFFGTGLVEPLDDLSGENPPSHPELLDELARDFARSGFDLKFLTRAIVLSKGYQLSASAPGGPTAGADPRLFARMRVRGLTGEQLYDSLLVAAGLAVERDDLDPPGAGQARDRFTAQFRIDRPADAERSMTQALSLINGRLTADLTTPGKSPILAALAEAPFLDVRGKVETLFLAGLARPPTEEELGPLAAHVSAAGNPSQALADVFWAVINSSEFNTNH